MSIREQVRTVLNVQLDNCTDEELKTQQNELNRRYDEFVKKYGIVNSRLNRSLFRDDADFALLISIENVDEKTGTATKTDVFSKRTIKPYQKVTHCETAIEALQVSKSEKGVVDIRFMEALTGLPYNTIIEELKGKIYRNPDKCLMDEGDKYLGWEDASEYLSGNVREKLLSAESALETNEEYRDNVIALRAVQPAPLKAADIGVNIGASWIDEKYYHQFICELLDLRKYDEDEITVYQNQFTGEWKVNRAYYLHSGVNTRQIYGTSRMDAYEVFEKCLNQQTPTITDEIEEADGRKKRVTNKEETIAVRERQKKMQEAFRRWIFDDPQRREYLVDKYNEIFNTTVVPQFDGSYLQFPGMNPEITLKPYQKDAVARILMGNNTLLHHSVGAGKTFEIAAACMKLREVGTAQKPIIVVPNHLVVQWANEFRTLYPMFDKVRSGEIRILLGSTEKCGAGTNVQDKLLALHHLDTPFRPSDLEQREGRIVRQGNKNPEVRLYTYVTKRTFDAYSYQLLETKQRFISQINNGDLTIREAEDIDDATLSYGQVKAIVSDNPKIMRKMEIEQKLGQLSVLENDHRNNRYRMQDDIIHAPEKIARIVQRIENYKQDIATRDLHKDDLIQIGKKQFDERKDAGELLIRAVQSGQYIGKTIGYFRGFGIVPLEKEFGTHYLKLVGAGEYKISISDSDVGTIARLENRTNDFEGDLKDAEIGKETVEHEVEIAKVEVNKPFEHQEEVEALQRELAEINAELDLEHGGEPVVLDNEGEDFGKLDIEILDEEDEDEAEAV